METLRSSPFDKAEPAPRESVAFARDAVRDVSSSCREGEPRQACQCPSAALWHGGDRLSGIGRPADMLLPKQEIVAIDVAIVIPVGLGWHGMTKVGAPDVEVGAVDSAVAVEVAGQNNAE